MVDKLVFLQAIYKTVTLVTIITVKRFLSRMVVVVQVSRVTLVTMCTTKGFYSSVSMLVSLQAQMND